MIDDGQMHVRLWVMARTNDNATLAAGLDRARVVGYSDNRLTVRAIKVQMDGALGSRGAWLLEPYSDPGVEPWVYGVDGRFRSAEAARQRPLEVASANWMASATLVARTFPDAIFPTPAARRPS